MLKAISTMLSIGFKIVMIMFFLVTGGIIDIIDLDLFD